MVNRQYAKLQNEREEGRKDARLQEEKQQNINRD